MTGGGCERVIVIGVGTEFRSDDGAGPAVIERLRGTVPASIELACSDGEPTRLMETWLHASVAIVVDAVSGGDAAPGTLHRVVVPESATSQGTPPVPGHPASTAPASSHGLGLGQAIELSRVLSRLPALLILHGVQGQNFGYGQAFSPAIAAAIDDLTDRVRADVLSVSAS